MRYSTWNKWDLHIHTRASKVKCEESEYFGAGNEFDVKECKDFCNIIMAKGVKLIAVTDHMYFNATQFLDIKKCFKGKGGNALPGVELKVFYYLDPHSMEVEYPMSNEYSNYIESKPLHCIIIFNDDKFKDLTQYQEIQKIFEKLYETEDIIYIGDVIDAIIKDYEFVLIPHFEKHNDLEEVVPDQNGKEKIIANMELKTKWIVGGFFSGLDGNVSKIKQSKIKAINYIKDNYDCDLPIIMTSDNHDYREYTDDVSEYKGLTTFNGLKLCFSDVSQRIRYKLDDIKKQDVISKIVINPSASSKIHNCEINFSPFLNCVIGGRSSGKSLLLAIIGKSVGERTNNHIDAVQTADFNKFLDRYNKYTNNADVRLFREDGSDYDGRIDIYLQDSIIKRFESADNSLLATDFKEEFNENYQDGFKIVKDSLISNFKRWIDLMDDLSTESRTLKSLGNIIPMLNIPSIGNEFIFYTDESKNKHEKLKANIKNLNEINNELNRIKEDYNETLKEYNDVSASLKELMDLISKKRTDELSKENQFGEILEIISQISDGLNENRDHHMKQFEINRESIMCLANNITEFIKIHHEFNSLTQKLSGLEVVEKENVNSVGNYKFIVKYTSKITPEVLAGILNNYRVDAAYQETLIDFAKTYIYDDKKWSRSRTTEAIKLKVEEEINQYIKKDYLIYEGSELINEMSEGRKASVFIDILLNKNLNQYPIIIDQPEDNMDNQDISKRLVESLRKRKNNRQIFVVTHNPNVLINGDAENVIVANKDDTGVINYKNAAIEYDEEFDMIELICSLVEGGANAFLKREKKYGLDITNSKNYGGNNK